MPQNITHSDLDILSHDLEMRRKEIEADEHAIARVRRMLGERRPIEQKSLLSPSTTPPPKGFKETVVMAMKSFDQMDYTVPMVVEMMAKKGYSIPEKGAKPRVSMIVKSLTEEIRPWVERVKAGTGSEPHVYRNKAAS